MALSYTTKVLGWFQNKETGAWFSYDDKPLWIVENGPHALFMSDGSKRTARVLKTVAYVAVDEDEYGLPVWEKWAIKKHTVNNSLQIPA